MVLEQLGDRPRSVCIRQPPHEQATIAGRAMVPGYQPSLGLLLDQMARDGVG